MKRRTKPPKKGPPKVEPKKLLASFLAAPESVRQSATERLKLFSRKAKLFAEEEQLRASKSKEHPSTEDLLADLIRVAEDKDVNPLWKFRTLSRKRYRLFGHYPIEFIDEEFGQFEHAKQIAGLEDKEGTRLRKAVITQHSKALHASRYLERYVMPFVLKDTDVDRTINGVLLILSISDTHSTFLDPFTWHVFLSVARDLKPDIIVFNGDILDGSEIHKYPKIPGWTIPLQLEFDFAREMFVQTRKVSPAAEIWWNGGNHGIDRLASYITQVAPAFSKLRSMRFDQLAGVADLGIKLAMGGTIASPMEQENDSPGILINGFYRIHHGTFLGEIPALKELHAANRSGQSGHVHRASLVFGTNEASRTLSWMSTPMGCSHLAGRAYMKGVTTGWQRGFGLAFLYPNGKVHQYPIICEDDICCVEGYIYKKPSNLPTPDPSTLWLSDLEIPKITKTNRGIKK